MKSVASLLSSPSPCDTSLTAKYDADICIYGGTSAGVVAAVQAAKLGKSVILVEAGRHLGGMSVEGLGCSDIDNHASFQNSPAIGGLALEFYRRVIASYGRESAFAEMMRTHAKQPVLWRFEPHVAESVFDTLVSEAGVTVLREHRLKETDGVVKAGPRITSLHFENGAQVRARIFIDGTYEGDLLAFAGVSFVVGREGNAKYGETRNGIRTDTSFGQFDRPIDPWIIPGEPASGVLFGVQNVAPGEHGAPDDSIQGYCFRLCLTNNPANRIPFEKPRTYDPTHYELQRRFIAAGGVITPPSESLPNGKTEPGSWHFLAGNFTGWNHSYPTANYAERDRLLGVSRAHLQGVYWFMTNDPVVPQSTRIQWASWGLCKDEFTDNGGWPRTFYIRNGRRMISDFVLTEAHLRKIDPQIITDPVGLTWWPPDLHHARRIVKNGVVWNEGAVFDATDDPEWIPCGIPYRALVPRATECVNLLTPTCPSSSYVAYGAYRIEFTFMAAAQSAAIAAVQAIHDDVAVQAVSYPKLRDALLAAGQVLFVPESARR